MTRDDVIDVLSAVAAGDNRTVGNTDVDLWCAVISVLDRDLAIRAVIEHRRECPGVWLEPGHVYQRVRAMHRDMLERESDAEREARQTMIDSRIVEHVDAISEATSIPDDELKYRRPEHHPLNVECPWEACKASVGSPCTVAGPNHTRVLMREEPRYHPLRIAAAKAQAQKASTT